VSATTQWPIGEQVIQRIRAETDTVLLAFSTGKDSLAAWLQLRPHFPRIVPIFKYLVPGLQFVERSLRYYEDYFQTRIVRVPHPSLYRWLRHLTFQAPENCSPIEHARLPLFDHEHVRDRVCQSLGLPAGTWIAVGTRACDSPQRRMAFNRTGPINERLRSFYPVWDWNKARLVECLQASGVKLPCEYRVFGRSFDGLDFRFLYGIKKHWPDDYRRILAWFPLAELEIKRHEYAQAAQARQPHAGRGSRGKD
jgi:hypothetical protein